MKSHYLQRVLFFIPLLLWSGGRPPVVVDMNPKGDREGASGHKNEEDPYERYSQFTRNETEVDAVIHYFSLLRKKEEEEVSQSKKEALREQQVNMNYRLRDIDKMLRNDPDLTVKYKEFFKERLRYNLKIHYNDDPRYKEFLKDLKEIRHGIKSREDQASEIFENDKMKNLKMMAKNAGVSPEELSAQEFAQKYHLGSEQGVSSADIIKTATTYDDFSLEKDMFFKIPEIKKEYERLYADIDQRFESVMNPYFAGLAKAEAWSRSDGKVSAAKTRITQKRSGPSLGTKNR